MQDGTHGEDRGGSPFQEHYLIALTESKAGRALDLDGFSRATVGLLRGSLNGERVLPPVRLQIGGRPAVQREIHGVADGVRVLYWHTSIDGPNNYYQVITWTLASKAEQDRPKLRQIVTTFREVAR